MNNLATIIKIEEDEAIVMTDDCIFKKVEKEKGMYLGQKILVKEKETVQGRKNKIIRNHIKAFAGIASIFLVAFLCLRFVSQAGVFAYVDVDINPSFRFTVDGSGRVRTVEPVNDHAKEVIKDVALKGEFIKEALLRLINVSKERGVIRDTKENPILISVALNGKYEKSYKEGSHESIKLNELLDNIEKGINQEYSELVDYEIIELSSKYSSLSKKNRISMGKYIIYENAREKEPDLPLEQIRTEKLSELLNKYDIDFHSLDTEGRGNSHEKTPLKTPTGEGSMPQTSLSTPRIAFTPSPIPSYLPSPTLAFTPPPSPVAEVSPTLLPKPTYTPVTSPVAEPTANFSGKGTGLRGEYYDNMDLTILKLTRIDPVIDFDWGEGTPDKAIRENTYSIRWAGKVEPRYSETYTFYTCTDDGVRLWVDGVLLIDKWKSQSATEYSGQIELEAGKKYEIKMEYYNHRRQASARLMWSSKGQQKEVIPQSQLYPSGLPLPKEPPNGLNAEYFGDMELKNLQFERIDDVIDFDWKRQPPVDGIKQEKFSIRWTGKVQTKYSEEYTFYTLADDGARVWVNDILIIDSWKRQESKTETSGKIELKEGIQYSIKIEYFNYGGPASMKLMWSSRRQEKQAVPLQNLIAN